VLFDIDPDLVEFIAGVELDCLVGGAEFDVFRGPETDILGGRESDILGGPGFDDRREPIDLVHSPGH